MTPLQNETKINTTWIVLWYGMKKMNKNQLSLVKVYYCVCWSEEFPLGWEKEMSRSSQTQSWCRIWNKYLRKEILTYEIAFLCICSIGEGKVKVVVCTSTSVHSRSLSHIMQAKLHQDWWFQTLKLCTKDYSNILHVCACFKRIIKYQKFGTWTQINLVHDHLWHFVLL